MNEGLLPLAGMRVVEFGQFIAIPAATQMLYEYGAEVIKVEPPSGDPVRATGAYGLSMLTGHNRGKRSVVLDLKNAQDLEVAEQLIASADVVCHNYLPGTMDRLGLSYSRMVELRADIISVSVSAFPAASPSSGRPGLDIAAQAESGLMSITGDPDREPQRVGVPIVDQATAYVAAQATLAALLRRDRFGVGARINIPLFSVAIHLQSTNFVEQLVTGQPLIRSGNGQKSAAPAADVITAKDGQFVLSAYQESAFRRLCNAVGPPDLLTDPRFRDNASRVAHRSELIAAISAAFSNRSVQESVTLLNASGVVAGEIRTYTQVLASEDARLGEVFHQAVSTDGRTYSVPLLPLDAATGLGRQVIGPVPELGTDTQHARREMAARAAGAQEPSTERMPPRPPFRDLPKRRAVHLYGPGDELGALNLLTDEATRAAARLVRRGVRFSLNAPLDYPNPNPVGSHRRPPTHHVLPRPTGLDDYYDELYPQYSSQWDGFLHVRDPATGQFHIPDTGRGVGAWAGRGIAGRAVLLDVGRWREQVGRPISWTAAEPVSAADLEECARAQQVQLGTGTILLVRFGWQTAWEAASPIDPAQLWPDGFCCPGFEQAADVGEYLWDSGVAAVAGDNFALEAFPFDPACEPLHILLLARLGIPIGEFWHLDELAADCARTGIYESFLTSTPLNYDGGIGSMANAIALV